MAYDIFISYKNTDDNQKTEDYYLALKLKKRLERENYNVFFSDEEIPKHKESIFSKIIEQALDEAKILVIVCTNPAYLKTSYVDYECSSFHDEIICGRKVGYIYGIGKNISHQELPYYLRRYDFYDFDSEMEKLILGINSFFTETREINNDEDSYSRLHSFVNEEIEIANVKDALENNKLVTKKELDFDNIRINRDGGYGFVDIVSTEE